ncbi:helix-turn-helix domain-containing protein [Streptomyces sp. 8N616]|uniref:helix-turn-helix domain-containing protein n=1 Tax=Streptomyces sp. 8N616 TaxID=3457414 RepID=UPI003FD315B4
MPRWRTLPEELDPQVREFTSQLRRLVDRSGLSVSAVADRTGYSRTSWERYLNGRLLPPQGAVVALAEVTGANSGHLTTMWELAERAWSRAEMRHDITMEAIRVAQARAALGELAPPPAKASKSARSDKGRKARKPEEAAAAVPEPRDFPGHFEAAGAVTGADAVDGAGAGGIGDVGHTGDGSDRDSRGSRRRGGRRVPMFLAGVLGALVVIAGGVLLLGLGRDDGSEAAEPPPSPTASKKSDLPAGVKCSGADCAGEDPEVMGCGGKYAETVSQATVGGAFIEVRYSEVCGAAWARITQAAPGDAVSITAAKRTESGTADADKDAYTRMVTVTAPESAKACARTKAGADGCTVPEAGATAGTAGNAETAGTAGN